MKAVETGDTAKLEALLSKKTVNPTKLGTKGFSVYVSVVLQLRESGYHAQHTCISHFCTGMLPCQIWTKQLILSNCW